MTDLKRKPVAEEQSKDVSEPNDEKTDAHLIKEVRKWWRRGDWEQLVQLDYGVVSSEQNRARVALVIACAHQQLDDHEGASDFVQLALKSGCDKQIAARLLISSVHNTLGRAATLQRNEKRALTHFDEAVKGVSGRARTAGRERAARELARLGLLRDVTHTLQKEGRAFRRAGEPVRRSYAEPESGGAAHRSGFGKKATKDLILVAGMRHCGSTALFNIVRIALKNADVPFVSGYAETPDVISHARDSSHAGLIKIHEFRDDAANSATCVLTARRDLRDTVASAARRGFGEYKKFRGAVGYAKYNRALYEVWSTRSTYEFIYERFMRAPEIVIKEVLEVLGLPTHDMRRIYEEVVSLPTDQYETTLLSPSHVTDPHHKSTFRETLDKAELQQIETQHYEWLSRFGYPI